MATIALFHHIQGLTPGVEAFAEHLREGGHTVHVPDMFEGRTFDSIEEGFGFARDTGFDVVRGRGLAVVDDLPADAVYAGLSFGVTVAQNLAQTRPGARGALFLYSCLPLSEFGGTWPEGLPVQIHGKEGDEFFDEDLPFARELAAATPSAELFVYPGEQHLFADSSLDAYDPEAAQVLLERVDAFLARL